MVDKGWQGSKWEGATWARFDTLGVPWEKAPVMKWRSPDKEEVKNKTVVGQLFRYKHAHQYQFACYDIEWVSNKKPSLVHYKLGVTEAKKTQFYLRTPQFLSQREKMHWVLENLPVKYHYLPKTGCSLHGDIDWQIELEDGTQLYIPWNY